MVVVLSDQKHTLVENYPSGSKTSKNGHRILLDQEITHSGSYTSVTQSSHSFDSHLSMNSISPQKIQQAEDHLKDISTPIKKVRKEPRIQPVGGVSVEPLQHIDYIHGGYAGAAPLLLKDEKWMMLLQHLMPEEHEVLTNYTEQVSHDNSHIDPLKVMKWAENNPVVAAYGVLNSHICTRKDKHIESPPLGKSRDYLLDLANAKRSALAQVTNNTKRRKRSTVKRSDAKYPAIDWDVFVDPSIVQDVDAAIQTMENLMNTTEREVYEEEIIAANVEIDRQTTRLASRMMLAHGSATQLLVEAVGVAARYNFSRVIRSARHLKTKIEQGGKKRRSVFGFAQSQSDDFDETWSSPNSNDDKFSTPNNHKHLGPEAKVMDVKTSAILVDRWLSIFASCLKLGKESLESIRFLVEKGKIRKDKLNKKSRSFRERTSQILRSSLSKSFDNDSTSSHVVQELDFEYQNPTFCGLFLCLGMKDPESMTADHSSSSMAESARTIKKFLGENLRLVLDMKSRHVPSRVWGRLIDHLRSRSLNVEGIGSFDIDELRQIENSTSTPVTTIFFFHSAGDLQRAIHANEVSYYS